MAWISVQDSGTALVTCTEALLGRPEGFEAWHYSTSLAESSVMAAEPWCHDYELRFQVTCRPCIWTWVYPNGAEWERES